MQNCLPLVNFHECWYSVFANVYWSIQLEFLSGKELLWKIWLRCRKFITNVGSITQLSFTSALNIFLVLFSHPNTNSIQGLVDPCVEHATLVFGGLHVDEWSQSLCLIRSLPLTDCLLPLQSYPNVASHSLIYLFLPDSCLNLLAASLHFSHGIIAPYFLFHPSPILSKFLSANVSLFHPSVVNSWMYFLCVDFLLPMSWMFSWGQHENTSP